MTTDVQWTQGFRWDCPACGRRNFGDLVEVDLQADAFPESMREDVDAMRAEGMDAALTGLMMPVRVRCDDCGSRYRPKPEVRDDD
jgi:hypothetical protein